MRADSNFQMIKDNPNILLDPEVYKLARGLSSKKRLALAKKFSNWSAQLAASARQMDSTLVTDIPRPSQIPQGFMLINMDEWSKQRLHEMAREIGCELRTVLGFFLMDATRYLEKQVSLRRMIGKDKSHIFNLYTAERN